MSSQSILDKVRKLRELANSSNANEAANAAAAAEKLIQEHRIAEIELLVEEEAPELQFIQESGVRAITWRSMLLQTICRNHSCETYLTKREGKTAYGVAGSPSDIETVRYLYSWLSMEVVRLASVASLLGKHEYNSFYLGAVDGIGRAMTAANKQSREVLSNSSALLRLDARLERAKEVLPGNLKTTTKKTNFNPNAYAEGSRAGENIHRGAALGAGGSKLLR